MTEKTFTAHTEKTEWMLRIERGRRKPREGRRRRGEEKREGKDKKEISRRKSRKKILEKRVV